IELDAVADIGGVAGSVEALSRQAEGQLIANNGPADAKFHIGATKVAGANVRVAIEGICRHLWREQHCATGSVSAEQGALRSFQDLHVRDIEDRLAEIGHLVEIRNHAGPRAEFEPRPTDTKGT